MKLLLDSSFPEYAPGELAGHGLEVERFTNGEIADAELIALAAERGFHAVAFLGRHALARRDVMKQSIVSHVSVVVTASPDPIDATRHLLRHRSTLRKESGVAALVLVTYEDATSVEWRVDS
jgi:hypothetical protein